MVRRRGARKRIFHTGRHLAALPILFTGAGNRTSGPVLRSGSPRLVIQEAWAWLTATQLVRASAAAALRSEAAAARALRRKDAAPVTADEESFTAARLHMIRSMAIHPGHGHLVTGRDRRRSRRRRPRRAARPERPRTAAALQARPESTPEIPARHRAPRRPSPGNPRSPSSPPASASSPPPDTGRQEGGTAPAPGPRTVEPRAGPAATRGSCPCPHGGDTTTKTDSRTRTEHERRYTPERPKHLKSLVLTFSRKKSSISFLPNSRFINEFAVIWPM